MDLTRAECLAAAILRAHRDALPGCGHAPASDGAGRSSAQRGVT